jgi:lysozyme family protein
MTPRFNKFLPFIYKWECVKDRKGNVIAENDPVDPGGVTKYGIDKTSHPDVDVRNLTEPQARAIYFEEWRSSGAETMRAGLGEVYFNACVNCGTGRAKKLLAVSSTATEFLDAQEAFYRRLAASKTKLAKFLKGWLNRTQDLRKFSASL